MDPTQTEAWARGIERAAIEAAQRPPDDGTISVSLVRYPERTSFKMCLACHHERGSALCPH